MTEQCLLVELNASQEEMKADLEEILGNVETSREEMRRPMKIGWKPGLTTDKTEAWLEEMGT
jgi:truncated hemoglobin YjbI